ELEANHRVADIGRDVRIPQTTLTGLADDLIGRGQRGGVARLGWLRGCGWLPCLLRLCLGRVCSLSGLSDGAGRLRRSPLASVAGRHGGLRTQRATLRLIGLLLQLGLPVQVIAEGWAVRLTLALLLGLLTGTPQLVLLLNAHRPLDLLEEVRCAVAQLRHERTGHVPNVEGAPAVRDLRVEEDLQQYV